MKKKSVGYAGGGARFIYEKSLSTGEGRQDVRSNREGRLVKEDLQTLFSRGAGRTGDWEHSRLRHGGKGALGKTGSSKEGLKKKKSVSGFIKKERS